MQLVQNSAARLVRRISKRDHITPVLRDLHWLPVVARVEYKVALMAFKCMHGKAPGYLQDLIVPYVPPRTLRSGGQFLLKEQRSKKKVGNCAFSFAGPKVFNNLPLNLREIDGDLNIFKSDLKTCLFMKHF